MIPDLIKPKVGRYTRVLYGDLLPKERPGYNPGCPFREQTVVYAYILARDNDPVYVLASPRK